MSEAGGGNNGTADSVCLGDAVALFDVNNDGKIDSRDLKDFGRMLGVNNDGKIDSRDLKEMWLKLDVNNDGTLGLKDILRMLLGDKGGSIVPNWKEALVIIIAVSIFGAIAFSFLT